jgi:hypothetical protein
VRHPSKSLGICAPRKTPTFTDQPYILVRDGVKLAGHDTIGALLRNVEDKGPGCSIVRTKDGVCVWPAECVTGVEAT